ncbi:unnamed protein product, partial [Closterium sp. NIES-53]
MPLFHPRFQQPLYQSVWVLEPLLLLLEARFSSMPFPSTPRLLYPPHWDSIPRPQTYPHHRQQQQQPFLLHRKTRRWTSGRPQVKPSPQVLMGPCLRRTRQWTV